MTPLAIDGKIPKRRNIIILVFQNQQVPGVPYTDYSVDAVTLVEERRPTSRYHVLRGLWLLVWVISRRQTSASPPSLPSV